MDGRTDRQTDRGGWGDVAGVNTRGLKTAGLGVAIGF